MSEDESIVLSPTWIRRAIGVSGFALPIVLVIGGLLFVPVQPTLSHYYHTKMNLAFVGLFAAVGLFMCAYRGYNSLERSAGFVVLVTSFMIGIFAPSDGSSSNWSGDAPIPQSIVGGHIHFAGTLLFFLLFWFFVWSFGEPRGGRLKLLEKKGYVRTLEKEKRDKWYVVCFWIMFGLGVIVIFDLAFLKSGWPVVLIGEWLTMWAFSLAWIIKGQWLFADKEDGQVREQTGEPGKVGTCEVRGNCCGRDRHRVSEWRTLVPSVLTAISAMLLVSIAILQLYAPSVAKYMFEPTLLDDSLFAVHIHQVSGKGYKLKWLRLLSCDDATPQSVQPSLKHSKESFRVAEDGHIAGLAGEVERMCPHNKYSNRVLNVRYSIRVFGISIHTIRESIQM